MAFDIEEINEMFEELYVLPDELVLIDNEKGTRLIRPKHIVELEEQIAKEVEQDGL